MSCNCNNIDPCSNTTVSCLCGVEFNIYNSDGELIETVNGYQQVSAPGSPYVINGSTAFESVLGQSYVLIIQYNNVLDRWEMSYYNETIEEAVVIGVFYGSADSCPASNCWDMDCIAVAFNVLRTYDSFFIWDGTYINGKKSYTFTSDWSGPDINYKIYWTSDSSTVPGTGSPVGTPGWILEEEVNPGVWQPTGFLFNSNPCPYGSYIVEFGGTDTRFSFTDLGVTGYDVKSSILDCGCCDTEVIVTVGDNEYTATVEYDEYGNILVYGGINYYTFSIEDSTYYIFYLDGQWVVKVALSISAMTIANLASTNECPFGSYNVEAFESFRIKGVDCFDCCDYYRPGNRNLLKKKKAIFVDEISSIRNKEIFGFKCGTSWDDLFRKHLIFDVLNCLPYGVICDEEEQCLINNLNENCNC
jgi:hypothetical protein